MPLGYASKTYQNQNAQQAAASEMFFVYNFPDVTLAANTSGSPQIQILSDSDFICTWLNYHSTGSFTVLMQDASSSQAFMTNPVNAADFMGTGQQPFPMLPPFRFPKNHVVIFTLQDTSGAQNKIGISMIGRKVFNS